MVKCVHCEKEVAEVVEKYSLEHYKAVLCRECQKTHKAGETSKPVKVEDIKDVNKLKTVDIKGKAYVMVHERIKEFRRVYPNHSLTSIVVPGDDYKVIIFKAEICDKDGRVLATGHAMEKADSSMINKTSHLENCETSAWGRALANFGIGIDNSMASADEVATAIKNQK